jgi:hypothetical protein
VVGRRWQAPSVHWPAIERVLCGLVLGSVLGIGLVAGLFVVALLLLTAIGGIVEPISSRLPWTDPVYTRAALHSLADVRIARVGIGAPGNGALVSILLDAGSSVLGRLVGAGKLTHG